MCPGIPERLKEIHRQCLSGASVKCNEDPVVRSDGNTDWVHWEIIPWHMDGGAVGGIVIFSETITERKMMREAALQANARLQMAQQAAGAGVWDWDITSDTLQWSRELFELFGMNPDEPIASFEIWRNAVHPKDREIASVSIDRALRGHEGLNSEYRIIRPDGQIRWINALGHACTMTWARLSA
jgi:PAS domain-containing protein